MADKNATTVAICSHEPRNIDALAEPLKDAGCRILLAPSDQEARRILLEETVRLAIVDSHPHRLKLLSELVREERRLAMLPVIISCQSNYGPAMLRESGYLDVLAVAKPVDKRAYVGVVKKALGDTLMPVSQNMRGEAGFSPLFIRKSRAMADLFARLGRISLMPYPVLIQSSPGADAESVAKFLHENGSRAEQLFEAVSCECLTETDTARINTLLKSIRKQDAKTSSRQMFGTVFFDNIAAMPLSLQAFVENLLTSESRNPADGLRPKVPRVMASTARNALEHMKSGDLREGLYYAISACAVTIPALNERREDIPNLTTSYLRKHCYIQRKTRSIADSAVEMLTMRDWPGGMAELENAIIAAVSNSERETISASDFPWAPKPHLPSPFKVRRHHQGDAFTLPNTPEDITQLKEVLSDFESAYIERTLRILDRDKELAARRLGVSLATLYRKTSGV